MSLRQTTLAVALAAAALAALAGCGSPSGDTPSACLQGPGAYLKALRTAPAAVKLDGETAISECLPENQAGGPLATVGESMVDAATRLNSAATAAPGGKANLELGYLLGAAQRAADSSHGIHAQLLRRLTVAARYSPGGKVLGHRFRQSYRQGFDAGHSSG